MDALSRYNAHPDDSGVADGILKNKFNFTSQKDLDETEAVLFLDTINYFHEKFQKGEIELSLSLLFQIHKYFLETLYTWAGKIRTVDISKDGMMFAPARYIENSLKGFEKLFQKNIPLNTDTKKEVAIKLAFIHIELNVIHPFREGNGRTIRLFLDLFAMQVGYASIDYSKSAQKQYFDACIAGMKQEYAKMEMVIYKGLKK